MLKGPKKSADMNNLRGIMALFLFPARGIAHTERFGILFRKVSYLARQNPYLIQGKKGSWEM